jgi:two-component system, chemotaxis family, chemotaxis protein CheY
MATDNAYYVAPSVLVVDDDPCIRKVLATVLDAEGYDVLQAANALEAIAHLQEGTPDLMLSDITMPLLKGDELCRQMHHDPRYSQTPVILMSASDEGPDPACGHSAFLLKPFELSELIDTITAVLGGEQGLRSRELGG